MKFDPLQVEISVVLTNEKSLKALIKLHRILREFGETYGFMPNVMMAMRLIRYVAKNIDVVTKEADDGTPKSTQS
jgi:hypothetical protein